MEEQKSSDVGEKVGTFVSSAVNRILNLIMILVIIALVALVAWFWHNNQLLEQKVEGLQDEVERFEGMSLGGEDEDVVVKEDIKVEEDVEIVENETVTNDIVSNEVIDELKTYKNDELGISFSYPKSLGKIINSNNEKTIFVFSEDENGSMLGGHSENYWKNTKIPEHMFDPAITYTGFIANKSLKSIWIEKLNGDLNWRDDYKITPNGNCTYLISNAGLPTAKAPEGLIYRAICNLKSSKMEGFNFSFGFGEKIDISEKEFIKMIESVKVY